MFLNFCGNPDTSLRQNRANRPKETWEDRVRKYRLMLDMDIVDTQKILFSTFPETFFVGARNILYVKIGNKLHVVHKYTILILFILVAYLIHIDTISIELSLLYFKGCWSKFL